MRYSGRSVAWGAGSLALTPTRSQPDRSDDLEDAIHLGAVGAVDVSHVDGVRGHLGEDRRQGPHVGMSGNGIVSPDIVRDLLGKHGDYGLVERSPHRGQIRIQR